jgi:hypothetical protein
VPLGAVVERVRELAAPLGARPLEAELVGLIPPRRWPATRPTCRCRDFDPERHTDRAPAGDR